MSGFLSKFFGGGKKKALSDSAANGNSTVGLVEEILQGVMDRGSLELNYEVTSTTANNTGGVETEEINIELTGKDEKLLTEKEGALLDALQLFIKRVVQHQLPDTRINVNFDSNGYREESNRSLLDLADKLKERALEQGRSVYLRALPPKDRKVIHQYLANDERVRSRSVGDGLYKKIKIYPVKNVGVQPDEQSDAADEMAADNA